MNATLRWSLCSIVLQSLLVEGQTLSGRRFELDVRLVTYRNPSNTLENGMCCNGSRMICQGSCNNHFSFCAGPAGAATVITSGLCPYGRINFTSNSDDITFSNGPSIVPRSSVANPILFLGRDSESVPNNLDLDIEIFHIADNGDLELVERFILTGSLTPSDTFGLNQTYTGLDARSSDLSLVASFRVRCSPNYVGMDCGIFCPPSERYTCDPMTGEIRCNTGYLDEATDCSMCVPAAGCNTTNGYCTIPGECICLPGYSGDTCDTELPTSDSIYITAQGSRTPLTAKVLPPTLVLVLTCTILTVVAILLIIRRHSKKLQNTQEEVYYSVVGPHLTTSETKASETGFHRPTFVNSPGTVNTPPGEKTLSKHITATNTTAGIENSDNKDITETRENDSYAYIQHAVNVLAAANPAYGTNIAIAPEVTTEENVAYKSAPSSASFSSQHDPTPASTDPSTASNPAYGTNVSIAPHIETQTNVAYGRV